MRLRQLILSVGSFWFRVRWVGKVGRLPRGVEQMPLASGFRGPGAEWLTNREERTSFPARSRWPRFMKFVTDDGHWLARRWEVCDRV